MQYFLTSDTHFGHASTIQYRKRPFHSVEEMGATLIANWNSVVKPYDVVYHLGDFAFTNLKGRECGLYIDGILSQLNGKIIVLCSSRDAALYAWDAHCSDEFPRSIGANSDWPKLSILPKNTIEEVRLNGHDIILSRHPMLSWERHNRGSIHFFGHVHSHPDKNPVKCSLNSYDVGVDNNEFYPISLENAIEKASTTDDSFMIPLNSEQ